jgi:RNA polymerase sigma-70 factor (ECF subfamily)
LEGEKLQTTPIEIDLTDDALVERTLAGDEDAFERLVARHSRRVFGIARKFFRSPETVEDIAQETFANAFFRLDSFRRSAPFEHWLTRITVNLCYDELRRRKRRGELLLTDLTEDESAWFERKLAKSSLEIQLGENERQRAAEVAEKLLAGLSADDHLVVVLLHAEQHSVSEIARMLGWSEGKVKTRAFHARHAMRRTLQRLTLKEQRMQRSPVRAQCPI